MHIEDHKHINSCQFFITCLQYAVDTILERQYQSNKVRLIKNCIIAASFLQATTTYYYSLAPYLLLFLNEIK